MLILERLTGSAAETESLGREIGVRLKSGSLWLLSGELGAGKTVFVRGLCRGLGVTDRVRSPSFTLVTHYRGGRLPVVHVDLYRLESPLEIAHLAWDDLAPENAVVVVEWGERARFLSASDRFEVEIGLRGRGEYRDDQRDERLIHITALGEAMAALAPAATGLAPEASAAFAPPAGKR